jgi:DNA-binding NtrC family response regulator
MKTSVLVVDDELLIRKSLGKVLRSSGYVVDVASTGAEGLEKVGALKPQVMILDMRLPDTDGLSVLRRARELDALLQVIIITAYGDVQAAVDAMKLGACDFVRKPYEMEDIVLAVESAARTFKQATELDLYRRRAWQTYSGEEIIGQSTPMKQVRDLIEKVVRSKATSVLITGESGTGKELVARAIHYRSDRAQAPLMEVNCSSFQEALLENELFGHEKGAYGRHRHEEGAGQGLRRRHAVPGRGGGHARCRPRLSCWFIDHRNFKRVGGARHVGGHPHRRGHEQDLDGGAAGSLPQRPVFPAQGREHLLPPLRERGDVAMLSRHFMQFSRKFRRASPSSPEAAAARRSIRGPERPRLRNLIERVVLLEEGERLEADHLPPEMLGRRTASGPAARTASGAYPAMREALSLPTLAQIEMDHISEVLKLTAGNKSRAARILGISRQGLIEKLRRLRIEESSERAVERA